MAANVVCQTWNATHYEISAKKIISNAEFIFEFACLNLKIKQNCELS